jgi:hypothetical protein
MSDGSRSTGLRTVVGLRAPAKVALVTFVPDLFQLSDGRFEATCGKCLARSPSIIATDEATAWEARLRLA